MLSSIHVDAWMYAWKGPNFYWFWGYSQLNNMYSVFHQWYSNLATFTLNGFAWFDLPGITKGEGVVGGGLMLPMVFYDSSKLGYFMVCSLKQNSRFPVTPSPTKKVPFPFTKPITKGTILTLSYGPTTYPEKDHLNHQGETLPFLFRYPGSHFSRLVKPNAICPATSQRRFPSNIDTENDGFQNVSPFKYGYFEYPC